MIRVLMEASVLGQGQYIDSARTGIYRVVDQIVRGLVDSGQCEVTLLSYGGSLEVSGIELYVQRMGRPDHLRAMSQPGARFLGNLIGQIKRVYDVAPFPHGMQELLRSVYRRFDTSIGRHQQKQLPTHFMKLGQFDIFHTPFVSGIPNAIRRNNQVRKVITIHDLIPVTHPQYALKATTENLHATLREICPEDLILTVSEYVKGQVCNVLKHDPDRVFVIPLAADRSKFFPVVDKKVISEVLHRYSIPEGPFILSLATFQPRKNLDLLIRSFTRMMEQEKTPVLNLVLAGAKGWDFDQILAELDRAKVYGDRIRVIGFVRDEDLAALYSGATAFIYPSRQEGFGLPPLEAMQCGTPVIVSNTSSLPEVVGDAGVLIDPDDMEGLSHRMIEIHRDQSWREQLSQRSIQRAALFGWQRHIELTLQVYRMAMGAN